MHTEWTETGYRLEARLAGGTVMLACESHALTGKGERLIWTMARLAIPVGTPRPEAERLLAHWLAFYRDDALSALGLAAFRTVFNSAPESIEPDHEASTGGQEGTFN